MNLNGIVLRTANGTTENSGNGVRHMFRQLGEACKPKESNHTQKVKVTAYVKPIPKLKGGK